MNSIFLRLLKTVWNGSNLIILIFCNVNIFFSSPLHNWSIWSSFEAIGSTRKPPSKKLYGSFLAPNVEENADIRSCTDASASRCCSSWICALYWNELVLGMAMWVEVLLQLASCLLFLLVHAMQSRWHSSFHISRSEIDEYGQDYAIANKLTPFISMQNHHNLLYREEEREMFPTLKVRYKLHCKVVFEP